jgi:hypothetical protein
MRRRWRMESAASAADWRPRRRWRLWRGGIGGARGGDVARAGGAAAIKGRPRGEELGGPGGQGGGARPLVRAGTAASSTWLRSAWGGAGVSNVGSRGAEEKEEDKHLTRGGPPDREFNLKKLLDYSIKS